MRKKSFTLVEVLIVLIIVSVIIVTVVGAFSRQRTSYQVEADSRKIFSDAVWVRQLAVSTHDPHGIRVIEASRTYELYRCPNGCGDDLIPPGDFTPVNLLKTAVLDSTETLASYATLVFYWDGTTNLACCNGGDVDAAATSCGGAIPDPCNFVTIGDTATKSRRVLANPPTGTLEIE